MPSEPHFDRYQFDKAMRPGSFENELLGFHQESMFGEQVLDPGDGFVNIKIEKHSTRHDSEQFSDLEFVKLVLLSVFPKLKGSMYQRSRAKHWLKIIRLYWHVGAPVSHIAQSTQKTVKSVERTIERIREKARQCTETLS